ncbi:MAG: alanine racemase [Candidatus Latescibacterota bacterium]|nr:MAG: alanine racemase [Candidatus Latescibacterota bacterium]
MKTLPAWVEVNLDALAHNVSVVRSFIGEGTRILLIVKADAYGHGAVEIAREAVRGGVHMLGVATVDEGRELRSAGIDAAILLLSPALPEEIPAILEAELRTTVPDLEFAARLSDAASVLGKVVPVHIEVDTGMGRSGFHADVAVEWIEQVSRLPGILVEGVFTHFPVSDTDVDFSRQQFRRFGAVVERLRRAGVRVALAHASNSAGILQIPEAHLDMVRPGGLLYGCLPHVVLEGMAPVRAVMSFHARLVQVRRLPPRSTISYGSDVMTCSECVVGVVPVGYGHGLSRAYSGWGSVLFRGQRVPILGRVTMDMTMVDLSGVDAPRVGEEVVLFGSQGDASIGVDEVAAKTGVITYEVLCGISKRVVRVYRRNGGVESMRGLTGVKSVTMG